ncbi:Ig-like domain-containing protein [Cohnella fermenti]|uniref:BIG2 domain-containing protein n=1 Tax=Cohnella fermenti TaxID=2565925 RepID=A0A4S4BJR5_9BACL|nr:Ig-like domain-containing protein [Cohnella fermenti]THF74922.1 hypothetical protein E6C55_23520 [Cohnella fermenti]
MKLMNRANKWIALMLAIALSVVFSSSAYGATTVTLSKIILSTNEVTLSIGDSYSLTATGLYSDNSTENLTVYSTWSSSDSTIASIYNGTITAKSVGTATVSATFDGVTQTAQVTVTKKVKALTKDTQSLDLRKGETATVKLTATYSDNTTANVTADADWSSTNDNVATVVNGVVTAIGAGTATITATYGSKTVTVDTKVEVISRLEASQSKVSMLLGGTAPAITLTATYSDGTTADVTTSAVWSSSDADVADVVAGTIRAYGAGTATLTATYGTKSAAIVVDVDKTSILSVSDDSLYLSVKGTQQLTLTATLAAGGSSDVTSSATWKSSDTSIASVDEGKITANKSGSAVITATYNGKSVTIAVDVDVAKYLDVSPTKLTLSSGGSSTLTVKATYADGTTADAASSATYSSDNEGAAFALKGKVTATKSGTAVITVSYGGKTADVTVYVDVPSKLTTSSSQIFLEPNEQEQADANAIYADNSAEKIVSGSATWTTSDSSIATVEAGLITAVAAGTATITATYNGKSVTMTVYVSTANRIELSKSQVSLLLNKTETIALTATYADGSTKDITDIAEWKSSNESVADILNGVVTGYKAGTATLTATYGSKTATIAVEVDATSILTASSTNVYLNIAGTKSITLTATLAAGGSSDVTSLATWSSSNSDVAYVSNGVITGASSGSATVTATYNGKSVKIAVDVEVAKYLDIGSDELAMSAGDSPKQLTLKATFSNGSVVDVTSKATWSSSNEDAASAEGGLVTPYKMGKTTVSASYGGKTATVTVYVDMPSKLTTTNKTIRVDVDKDVTADLTAVFSTGEVDVRKDAEWTSKNGDIATVKDGVITGVKEGSTTVVAEYGDLSVTYTVKVGLMDELTPSTRLITLSVSDSEQITLTAAVDENSAPQDVTSKATWKSSKASVADVKKGLITGYAKGKTTITATYGGQTVTISVEVDQISRIELSQAALSLKSGNSSSLDAVIVFSNGDTKTITDASTAEWKSSNVKVATVKNGKVTAVAYGKATISVKYAGKTAKLTVDVDTLKYLETNYVNITIAKGATLQVTATATFMDQSESDVSKLATWTSSKTSVATAKDGLIKTYAKGKTTLTVSYAGKKFKVYVTVV